MSSFLFISTTSIHPIIAFEHLNLYIQLQLDSVTIGAIPIVFREYLCRTLGNCCRLYGKTLRNLRNDKFYQRTQEYSKSFNGSAILRQSMISAAVNNNWQQRTTIRVATCISDAVLSQTNVGVESNNYCLCNTQYSDLKMPQLNRSMTHVGELGAEQRPTRMSWTRSSRQSWWRLETMVIILVLLKQFEQQI